MTCASRRYQTQWQCPLDHSQGAVPSTLPILDPNPPNLTLRTPLARQPVRRRSRQTPPRNAAVYRRATWHRHGHRHEEGSSRCPVPDSVPVLPQFLSMLHRHAAPHRQQGATPQPLHAGTPDAHTSRAVTIRGPQTPEHARKAATGGTRDPPGARRPMRGPERRECPSGAPPTKQRQVRAARLPSTCTARCASGRGPNAAALGGANAGMTPSKRPRGALAPGTAAPAARPGPPARARAPVLVSWSVGHRHPGPSRVRAALGRPVRRRFGPPSRLSWKPGLAILLTVATP